MKKSVFLISIIFLYLFSCVSNTKTELTAEQKASIEEDVKGIYSDVITNLSKMDMDIWSEPWSKNEFICVNSGANYFNTLIEFKDSVNYWFSLRESQKVEIIQVNVTALTDELVLLNSIAKWDITFKQGEKMNVDALATMLWRKENNGWKIIFLHESWQ
jgi:hypothetical protein